MTTYTRPSRSVIAALAVTAGLGLAGCSSASTAGSSDSAASTTTEAATGTPAATGSGVIDVATWKSDMATAAENGPVVLFFNAAWCPTCRSTSAELKKAQMENSFPANLTVVDVDYDSETDLRETYGVTVQHTFVQVDAQGEKLMMWNGSDDADAILEKVS